MPWASKNHVSHDEISGGIQISEAQYAAGVAALVAGKSIDISKGFAIVGTAIDPAEPGPLTVDDVGTERDRRLGLGFDYDFKDDRGLHHFNTTAKDMEGWDLVTKLKDTLFQIGDTTTTISIETATGEALVTGPEWNAILLYAAINFQQPLWKASLALEKVTPIPADYADNKYWPA